MIILTHRGLEPSKSDFFPESSFEAFEDQLKRGFGIEFDPNLVRNGFVVNHDSSLRRISNGVDERNFADLTVEEIKKIRYCKEKKGRIPFLSEILELIANSKAEINAMHLKWSFQAKEKIDLLLDEIMKNEKAIEKLIVFDVKPWCARYIKGILPKLKLAPSVAHKHDIERYNGVVVGTLLSIDDAIRFKGIYDWVWLDEWDLMDKDGEKKFYTKDNFNLLRGAGYKIGLVTPELHGTSPGLLGGEAHSDAKDKEKLFSRIEEILKLKPDVVCTDYPEEVLNMYKHSLKYEEV